VCHLFQDFFAEMQDREEELGISDIQLSLATLEEIFLKIARQAEVETAAADGSFTTLNLPSGTLIQVCHCFQMCFCVLIVNKEGKWS
jgi:hypothetical protein